MFTQRNICISLDSLFLTLLFIIVDLLLFMTIFIWLPGQQAPTDNLQATVSTLGFVNMVYSYSVSPLPFGNERNELKITQPCPLPSIASSPAPRVCFLPSLSRSHLCHQPNSLPGSDWLKALPFSSPKYPNQCDYKMQLPGPQWPGTKYTSEPFFASPCCLLDILCLGQNSFNKASQGSRHPTCMASGPHRTYSISCIFFELGKGK